MTSCVCIPTPEVLSFLVFNRPHFPTFQIIKPTLNQINETQPHESEPQLPRSPHDKTPRKQTITTPTTLPSMSTSMNRSTTLTMTTRNTSNDLDSYRNDANLELAIFYIQNISTMVEMPGQHPDYPVCPAVETGKSNNEESFTTPKQESYTTPKTYHDESFSNSASDTTPTMASTSTCSVDSIFKQPQSSVLANECFKQPQSSVLRRKRTSGDLRSDYARGNGEGQVDGPEGVQSPSAVRNRVRFDDNPTYETIIFESPRPRRHTFPKRVASRLVRFASMGASRY
ncbi:hypothetical protein B0H34DRAFT_732453 [Crassisporium funariophilum]|nr:hypothetical protein B0H34DRAFT_732453 [Crassisporium funariophilum]